MVRIMHFAQIRMPRSCLFIIVFLIIPCKKQGFLHIPTGKKQLKKLKELKKLKKIKKRGGTLPADLYWQAPPPCGTRIGKAPSLTDVQWRRLPPYKGVLATPSSLRKCIGNPLPPSNAYWLGASPHGRVMANACLSLPCVSECACVCM